MKQQLTSICTTKVVDMEQKQQITNNTRTNCLKNSVDICHNNKSNSKETNDNFIRNNKEQLQQHQEVVEQLQKQEPNHIGLSTPIRNSYRNHITTHKKLKNNNNDTDNKLTNTEVSNGFEIMTSTSIFDLLYGKRQKQTTTTTAKKTNNNKLFPKGKHGQPLCFDVIVIGGGSDDHDDDGNGNNDKNYDTYDSPHSPISELTGISYLLPSPIHPKAPPPPPPKTFKRTNGKKGSATAVATDVVLNDINDPFHTTIDNSTNIADEHDNNNPPTSSKKPNEKKNYAKKNNDYSNNQTKTSTTRIADYRSKVFSCSTNENDNDGNNNDHNQEKNLSPDQNAGFSIFSSYILKDLLDDFHKCFRSSIKNYFKDDWYCPSCCHMSNQVNTLDNNYKTCTTTKLYQITYSIIITSLVQLLYTMAFGVVLHTLTDGTITMLDTIVSTSISGVIHSIVSGQPLLLHNVNIPIILFFSSLLHTIPLIDKTTTITTTIESYNKTLYFWMIVASSLLHILAASIGIVRKLSYYITPFICQTYELFISLSIIIILLRETIRPIHILEEYNISSDGNNSGKHMLYVQHQRSVGYASVCLSFLTVILIMTIQYIVRDRFYLCTHRIRKHISLYTIPIVCLVVTIVSYIPGIDQSLSTVVTTSSSIETTNDTTNVLDNYNNNSTRIGILRVDNFFQQEASSNLINLVNPFNIGTHGTYQVVVAFVFGCLLFVSSIVHETVCFSKIVRTTGVNTESTTTTKKALTATTNTWDFFIIGCSSFILALFGLPVCPTSYDVSMIHIQSLTLHNNRSDAVTNNESTLEQQLHQTHNVKEGNLDTPINAINSTTASKFIINKQRWSGLIQSLILLLVVALSSFSVWEVPLLNRIPVAFLYGMLFYVGISSFQSNDIVHRMVLYCCMTQENRQMKEQQQQHQIEMHLLFENANIIGCNISWIHVQIYTLVQLSFGIGLAIVTTYTSMGYLFPTGLILLFLVRWYYVKQQFPPNTAKYLDSSNQYLCVVDLNAMYQQQQLPITIGDLQQNSTDNDDTGYNNDDNTENQIDLPAFLDAIEDEDETTFHTPRCNKHNNTSLSLLVPDLSFSLSPTGSCHSPMRTKATALQQQQQHQMQKKVAMSPTTKSESMLVGVFNSNVTNAFDVNSISDSENALFNLELLSS